MALVMHGLKKIYFRNIIEKKNTDKHVFDTKLLGEKMHDC